MSQWTHINASIRFDTLMGMGEPTREELGEPCYFENMEKCGDKLPYGSEGSLDYRIIQRTDCENCMASHAVVFFGDLRDYDDVEEIMEYFNNITKDKIIRSGIIEIEVESNRVWIYRFSDETNKFEKV